LAYQLVWRQKEKTLRDCLANQHPVKGVFVQHRQSGDVKRGLFIKRQLLYSLLLSLFGNKSLRGGSGKGSRPKACLTAISQADTALK
jgi:hypothetical protein